MKCINRKDRKGLRKDRKELIFLTLRTLRLLQPPKLSLTNEALAKLVAKVVLAYFAVKKR